MQGRYGYELANCDVILGTGRHCIVKLATSTRYVTPRKVAMKVAELSTSSHEEAEILFKLSHDNIVEIFDYFLFGDKSYIVLELAGNGNLRNFVRQRGRLGEVLTRKMSEQLFDGVTYLHDAATIAHCDLKCENVLVDAREDIKIADFGQAVDINENSSSTEQKSGSFSESNNNFGGGSNSYDSASTMKGLVSMGGSPAYAAPEVLDGRATDLRAADVWSAAVIIFFMLTAYLPFGCHGNKNIREAMNRPLRWPRPLKLVRKADRSLVQSVLVMEPSQRPAAREVLGELRTNSH